MADPLFNNAIEHFSLFFTGGLFWSITSYALQTFPAPKNKYAIWIMGIIQFAFANKDLGQKNFSTFQAIRTGENRIPNG